MPQVEKKVFAVSPDEVGPTVPLVLDRRRPDGRRVIQVPLYLIEEINPTEASIYAKMYGIKPNEGGKRG